MGSNLAMLFRTSTAPHPEIPVLLFMGAVAGVPIGIYLFYRGFSLLARKRLIQNIPRCAIRSAAIGQVEISGRASGPYTILSPLSQTDCYYYRAEAHPLEQEGDRRTREAPSVEVLSVPFFIEDETGRVMVDARGAESELQCTFDTVESAYAGSESVQHFMARRGLGTDARARLIEYCVVKGDPLFVLGTLAENSPDGSKENEGNNFLSPEAAALQRETVLEYMHLPLGQNFAAKNKDLSVNTKFELHPPVVLRKGGNNEPFMISQHSQKEVVDALASQSFAYIWGGPLLALTSLAYLLIRLSEW